MTLLDLGPNGLSLEFAAAEWPALLAELERSAGAGGLRRERRVSHDVAVVGGCEFVLMDEWDEPCLIAGEPAGGASLRDVFGRFGDGRKVGTA